MLVHVVMHDDVDVRAVPFRQAPSPSKIDGGKEGQENIEHVFQPFFLRKGHREKKAPELVRGVERPEEGVLHGGPWGEPGKGGEGGRAIRDEVAEVVGPLVAEGAGDRGRVSEEPCAGGSGNGFEENGKKDCSGIVRGFGADIFHEIPTGQVFVLV